MLILTKQAMRAGMLVLPHQALYMLLFHPGLHLEQRKILLKMIGRMLIEWRVLKLAALAICLFFLVGCGTPALADASTPTLHPTAAATASPAVLSTEASATVSATETVIAETETPTPAANVSITQEALDRFCASYAIRTDGEIANSELRLFTFAADSPLVSEVISSCNYEMRTQAPVAIIIHGTEGPGENAINHWRNPNATATHYLITREGKVIQIVAESRAAWHAGPNQPETCNAVPFCQENPKLNVATIGIELENLGWLKPVEGKEGVFENSSHFETEYAFRVSGEPVRYYQAYAEPQIEALLKLVADIKARRPEIKYVLGHNEVQSKTDPGPAFEPIWPLLRQSQQR